MKSLLKRLILLAITALFLYLVLRKVEPAKLWQALTQVYWPLLVPVVMIYLGRIHSPRPKMAHYPRAHQAG